MQPLHPHAMCAHCQHVFAADVSMADTVRCPACGEEGRPAGIMRPSGFPSLESFKRSWLKAREAERRK